MRHSIFYLALGLLILGCKSESKKTNTEDSSETQTEETSSSTETSNIGRANYAIVWKWTTSNEQLVADNVTTISNELSSLWKRGVVENVYYNSDSKVDKLSYFPNISFCLRAESYESAEVILNNLTIVKKGIAVYQIFPIGTLWLDRKSKTIHEKGMTKSFVSVWTTTGKPSNDLTQVQNDKILELWKEGTIENVYFDIEGTQKPNEKTDFVFYVNANSEEEAKALCDSLPFANEGVATYELHSVGVFWMGKYTRD